MSYENFDNSLFDYARIVEVSCLIETNHFASFWKARESFNSQTIILLDDLSTLVNESNAIALYQRLKHFPDEPGVFRRIDKVCDTYFRVSGYEIKPVADKENFVDLKRFTLPFLVWCQAQKEIAQDFVLSEDIYNNFCYQDCLSIITEYGDEYISDQSPQDWAAKVYELLDFPCDSEEIDEEEVIQAISESGWLKM